MIKLLLPVLSILCLTAGCMSVGGVSAITGKSPPHGNGCREEFTIISWNIGKRAPDAVGLNRLTSRYEPDLICLQESTDLTRRHLEHLFPNGYFGCSWRRFGSRTLHGIAIASRYELTDPKYFLSPSREFFFFTPKSALLGFIELPENRRLQIINVHALNFMPVPYVKDQLQVIYEAARTHGGPMVVCGDFNTWNGSRIKAVQQFAAKLGMVEALAYHDKGGMPSRWAYLADPFIEIQMDATLDRVFCRGMNVIECRRLDSFTGADHPPILLRAKIH